MEQSTLTDEQLIRQASVRGFEAFQDLVERFQDRVFAVGRRITGNLQDAEDVTQQTFLSLIEHLDGFRGESSAATWILRIATNHALKILRKRRGLPLAGQMAADADDSYSSLPHPEFIAHWQETPEALVERAEVGEQIESALELLDEKYRLVFLLRDVQELSVRETAEALGLTEANVKVRLLRARLMLREHLTRVFGDESTRVFPSHDHG
ncbi:MAG TPA: sigma-70 family RNA polymerase sigma factor [Pirellulaceae bacterium]|nr:sigma-70 family RNA polymerase sigma factor [Pirellulaceae bacterium]HMO90566.1 sigma-70 family RNA polymerase sigma factor [Pirellulaceae bacterium]HMP71230.1 sigma-70 family RNA polymerase sigma factor [Pirellulaceae bacterium]